MGWVVLSMLEKGNSATRHAAFLFWRGLFSNGLILFLNWIAEQNVYHLPVFGSNVASLMIPTSCAIFAKRKNRELISRFWFILILEWGKPEPCPSNLLLLALKCTKTTLHFYRAKKNPIKNVIKSLETCCGFPCTSVTIPFSLISGFLTLKMDF